MALVIADRVRETTTTTGTGTVTLAGAVLGFQSFAVVGDGNITYYCIAGQGTSEWEVGIGTYTASGTTLSRTTVLSSSNGGSLVNFSAGAKDVFVTYPSERSVNYDSAGTTVALTGNLTFTGTLGVGGANFGANGQYLVSTGALTAPQWKDQSLSLTYVIDGGGVALSTGVKGDLEVPFACTINQWTLLADQSGSVVVDIWKDTYANYPPTVADTITGSAKPTISTAVKGQSSTLTGWTTSIAEGDTLRFNVDSATTITRVTLSLKVTRT